MNAGSIIFKKDFDAAKPTLIFEDRIISRGEILSRTRQLAAGLRQMGIKKGDRVALLIANRPENLISYFAVLIAGGVAVPINTQLKEAEIRYILKDSRSRALIFSAAWYDRVCRKMPVETMIQIGGNHRAGCYDYDRLADRSPGDFDIQDVGRQDNAHIIYTTGTTGKPKGVVVTHANLAFMARGLAEEWDMLPDDKIVMPLPLFHVYGLLCSTAMMMSGSINILIEKFKVDLLIEILMRYRPAGLMGVPTIYKMMLNHIGAGRLDMSFLKYCASGAESLPLEILTAFRRKFSAEIVEGYGLSEATVSVCKNPIYGKRKPKSVGVPFPGVSVSIVDPNDRPVGTGQIGEIIVKGPNVMKEYLNDPQRTRRTIRNGWLHTGDLGYCDDEGYIYIVDRSKDMYIRGGENVYPREIEEVLYQHDSIMECAVVGVPDDLFGQVGKAFVITRNGNPLDPEQLTEFCRRRLADYKVPKYFEFRNSFPKTATGKILKRQL
ncbi:MAG: long-chain fatty acid--CoA ligase [Deltaproteobacteria bacterium]|nr:long-chain fatty acid--CoA ligase [Deltaproteobacteria bacterium]